MDNTPLVLNTLIPVSGLYCYTVIIGRHVQLAERISYVQETLYGKVCVCVCMCMCLWVCVHSFSRCTYGADISRGFYHFHT